MAQNKAENVLKRVEDLLQTGTVDDNRMAVKELQDALQNRRTNRIWSEVLEQLMKKYVEVSVPLRKAQDLKIYLIQYKSACNAANNMKALDTLIQHYIDLAEKRLALALSQMKNPNLDLTTDADSELYPENVLMAALADENPDRADRELVAPWLKFVWETYRNVLEVFRNNPSEARYHDTAVRALKYCKRYKRKSEFRRLADAIRNHFSSVSKYSAGYESDSSQSVSDSSKSRSSSQVESSLHLDTRFQLLAVAADLELWQEAYKTVEDISYLFQVTKRAPKSIMMANYYEQLARIFWVSQNYLLHAFAYVKLFRHIQASASPVPEATIKHVASSLLLATLAIPENYKGTQDADSYSDLSESQVIDSEKSARMASLLGAATPTREQLLSVIVNDGVIQAAYPQLGSIFETLQQEFDPTSIGAKVSQLFEFLGTVQETTTNLKSYIPLLRRRAINKLLVQVAEIYSVIKLEELVKLSPVGSTLDDVERELVQLVHDRVFQVSLDHQNGIVSFAKGQGVFDSESIRHELTLFAKRIRVVSNLISQEERAKKRLEKRQAIIQLLKQKSQEEHTQILARKQYIEKKRVWEESEKQRQFDAAQARKKEQEQKKQKAEELRMQEETKQREEAERKRKEELEKEKKANEILEKLALEEKVDVTELKNKLLKQSKKSAKSADIDEALAKTAQQILDQQKDKAERDKKDKDKRLIDLARHFEYLERARREEEIPLIVADMEQQKVKDKEAYDEMVQKQVAYIKREQDKRKTDRDRIARMIPDKNYFLQEFVMKKRVQEYTKLKESQDKRREEAKYIWEAKRKKVREVVEQRKREKEEAEQRKRDEDARKRREDEERKREQDKQAELQQKRYLEMEERMRKEKEAAAAKQADQKKPQQGIRGSNWSNESPKAPPANAWGNKSGFGAAKNDANASPSSPSADAKPKNDEWRGSKSNNSGPSGAFGRGKKKEDDGWETVGNKKPSSGGRGYKK